MLPHTLGLEVRILGLPSSVAVKGLRFSESMMCLQRRRTFLPAGSVAPESALEDVKNPWTPQRPSPTK
jgi:hypothetical protein